MKNQEPNLCPNCPLKPYVDDVKQESWCRVPNDESNIKICARLRALSEEDPNLPKCPYYKNESLIPFFSLG